MAYAQGFNAVPENSSSAWPAAAATPFLLKAVKPIVKQIIKRVKKLFGKEPPKLSASEIQTNKYREKKGLPPFKRPKK